MPQARITYAGLIRAAVGCRRERVRILDGLTLGQLLAGVVRRHGPIAGSHLFDAAGNLLPQAVILVDGLAARDTNIPIDGGGVVQVLVLSPVMAGA